MTEIYFINVTLVIIALSLIAWAVTTQQRNKDSQIDVDEMFGTVFRRERELTERIKDLESLVQSQTLTISIMLERMRSRDIPVDDIPIPAMPSDRNAMTVNVKAENVTMGDLVGDNKNTAGRDIDQINRKGL